MFKQKTTIVLGAGASCEIGLPSGDGLKEQIISLLRRTDDNAYGFSDDTMQQIMAALVGPDVTSFQNNLQSYKAAADRIGAAYHWHCQSTISCTRTKMTPTWLILAS